MGNVQSPDYVTEPMTNVEAERQELEWLLTSGVLGRSGNLARVLKYICEERFAGRAHQIREFTIATEALGRRADFDPSHDTIVRVTVHSLRKRLVEVYQKDGAARPIRLVIPPGHYDPQFVSAPPPEKVAAAPVTDPSEDVSASLPAIAAESQVENGTGSRRLLWSGLITLLVVIALSLWGWRLHASHHAVAHGPANVPAPPPPPQGTIHALMGSNRRPYTDHSGVTWAVGSYCHGGEDVSVPPQNIAGTEDAPLYYGGTRGIAHCVFPVTQKLYELHFHFAETSDLPAATRSVSISINAAEPVSFDVVDEAGGDGIATSTVVTGVAPENDGAIHVDITSEVSLLSAVEMLPAPSPKLLPVRIVASSKAYVDSSGQLWLSDRYFSGGRHGLPPESAKQGSFGIFDSDRIGRFRYNIPVAPHALYKVRLYFREPWFGKENGGLGGPGSRVFDVTCNGESLLKSFDIIASGNGPVVKTFDHVASTADGRIELSFRPVTNYAIVNAIEVLPEN